MIRRLVWVLPLAFTLLAIVPLSSAQAPTPVAAATVAASIPHPLGGTVVNCTSTQTCSYAFKTSAGSGWANSTGSSSSTLRMALQLPGEAKASYNLSYSTYIARLTGTYTYWTAGTFLGTDVNTGHVVYGTTNTNYTITCVGHSGRGGGCKYVYTTDNGTIVVRFTNAEITSTSVACSSSSTSPGVRISCQVTVANGWKASNYPNGTVRISSGRTGTISNKGACTLSSGTCKFTYVPGDNTCGSVTLSASYPGNAWYYRSSGSILISVIVSGGC